MWENSVRSHRLILLYILSTAYNRLIDVYVTCVPKLDLRCAHTARSYKSSSVSLGDDYFDTETLSS